MIGLRIAGSFLRRAICEIREESRYRYYPLYSALLGGLVYVWCIWPWDNCLEQVFWDHPRIFLFNYYVVDTACVAGICCGIVGVLRRGLVSKILSGVGIYVALWWLEPPVSMSGIRNEVLYYVFDVPAKYIFHVAGFETGGATLLWCGYFLVVYLLARPLLIRAYRGIESLAHRAMDRYPMLERLDRPVL